MARVYGITSIGLVGVLQTVTKSQSVEIAEALGADGKVTDQKAYSKTNTVKAEYLFDGAEPPEAGTTISFGGKTYLIKSVEKSESNKEYQKGSMELELKDNATISAYA